jgi:membrane protease YdiL (CAAX protease family)
MDEQNNAALPVEPAAETKKKRRPIRHMIWAVCLIALLIALLGQIAGDFLVGLAIKGFGITDASTLFLFMYLSMIGVDLLVLLYTLLCERPIFRSFGRHAVPGGRGNTWKLFGVGLLAGFAMNALCILAAWLHGDIVLSVGRFNAPYLLAALVCVCVQSGAEELLTRGYMLGALRDRYPLWLAVAVNSLFFGTLHLFNNGITVLSFVNIVAFGLALSFVMVRLESLWFCIAVHTAWNFSQSIFFGLPNSGIVSEGSFLHLEAARDSAVYSALFCVEGAITTTLVLLVLVLCVLLCKRRKQAV